MVLDSCFFNTNIEWGRRVIGKEWIHIFSVYNRKKSEYGYSYVEKDFFLF